jgi:hypothetical protein
VNWSCSTITTTAGYESPSAEPSTWAGFGWGMLLLTVATPCCPAPVSAMMRSLPMRLHSMAWPSALLILCAPVWLRSSRLR